MSDYAKGEFSVWFEAQFGKRPKSKEISEIRELETVASRERDLWRRRNEWDAKREAALYAWSVHKTKKAWV